MLSGSKGTYFKCSSIIPCNMFKIGMMFTSGNVSPSLWKMSPRKCRLIVMPAKLPACRPLTVTMVTSLRIANKMDKCTALVSLDTLALAIIINGLDLKLIYGRVTVLNFPNCQISKQKMSFWDIRFILFDCFPDSFWLVLHTFINFVAVCQQQPTHCPMFWDGRTLLKILVFATSFFTSS